MIIVPIGLIKRLSQIDALDIAVDASAITHGHPFGYYSGGAMAMILLLILDDFSLFKACQFTIKHLE